MQDKFDQKKVEISFRKFSDYASDLLSADRNTFDNQLKIFLHHCENDEIMKIITEQLKSIDVQIDEWWEKGNNSAGSMIGSARFVLPIDETERDALLYQFSLKIRDGKMSFKHFCLMYLGKSNYNEMVYSFNRVVMEPLIRSINYKLEEIIYGVHKKYDTYQDVPINVFYVYNDSSTSIKGNLEIKGDGVIGDGSKIEKK